MAFNLQKYDLTTIFVRYFLHVRSSAGGGGGEDDLEETRVPAQKGELEESQE